MKKATSGKLYCILTTRGYTLELATMPFPGSLRIID
jgi:hypothetical protein